MSPKGALVRGRSVSSSHTSARSTVRSPDSRGKPRWASSTIAWAPMSSMMCARMACSRRLWKCGQSNSRSGSRAEVEVPGGSLFWISFNSARSPRMALRYIRPSRTAGLSGRLWPDARSSTVTLHVPRLIAGSGRICWQYCLGIPPSRPSVCPSVSTRPTLVRLLVSMCRNPGPGTPLAGRHLTRHGLRRCLSMSASVLTWERQGPGPSGAPGSGRAGQAGPRSGGPAHHREQVHDEDQRRARRDQRRG